MTLRRPGSSDIASTDERVETGTSASTCRMGLLAQEDGMKNEKKARKRKWQVGCNYVGHLVDSLKVYSRQERFAMKKYRLWLEEV